MDVILDWLFQYWLWSRGIAVVLLIILLSISFIRKFVSDGNPYKHDRFKK